jgi:hypothetical protein
VRLTFAFSPFLSYLLPSSLLPSSLLPCLLMSSLSCHRRPTAPAADTPFEDGTFRLILTFDESYPNKPPVVKFLSKMFHPNVYANGELCLDILQNRWSPTYDVAAILTSIQSLLHDPNPNSCVHVLCSASPSLLCPIALTPLFRTSLVRLCCLCMRRQPTGRD